MNTLKILREVAQLTTAVGSFGHGPRAYGNLDEKGASLTKFIRDGQEKMFPQIWVHPVTIEEDFKKTGSIEPVYTVIFHVATQVNVSTNPENLEAVLQEMNLIRREFVLRLSKHAEFSRFKTPIRSEPMYHRLSQNLVGYLCRFDLETKKAIEYPCS